jgi:hypothetical protein
MKTKILFFSIAFLISNLLQAQPTVTDDVVQGSITMLDGTIVQGTVKDKIKKSASIIVIDEVTKKKKVIEGHQILTATINKVKYVTIGGDFFTVLADGKLSFLQKNSDASNKIKYSGSNPVGSYGTDGNINDFFIYSNNVLEIVHKKNMKEQIKQHLINCAEAYNNANNIKEDVILLQKAIEIFNNCK